MGLYIAYEHGTRENCDQRITSHDPVRRVGFQVLLKQPFLFSRYRLCEHVPVGFCLRRLSKIRYR